MIDLDKTDFNSASSAYLVANTPLFLLRKLREDPNIGELARSVTSEQLFDALKYAAQKDANTLADRVRPFILLVALAIKGDINRLRETTGVRPPIRADWFDYLCRVLIETHRPTMRSTIKLATAKLHGTSASNSGATEVVEISLSKL